MICAIASDVHSNLQAWNAVLTDIRSIRADKIIILGDIIGYGPDPVAVLESIHANADYIVIGNHDAALCGKIDIEQFNDYAAEVIKWTRANIAPTAISFLNSLPLTINAGMFRCTHGDFSDPSLFNYILEPQDAVSSWKKTNCNLLFAGHTHKPAVFILDKNGKIYEHPPIDFMLQKETRYLITVGSVGNPRDGDIRATYCLYDTKKQSIYWRKIPFDIDAYKNALYRASLPLEGSSFLKHDPRTTAQQIRKQLSFAPLTSPPSRLQENKKEKVIADLQNNINKWKIIGALSILVTIVTFLYAVITFMQNRNKALLLEDYLLSDISTSTADPGKNILQTPSSAIAPNNIIPGYRVKLGDKNIQSVSYDPKEGFIIQSSNQRILLEISSPAIRVEKGMRFRITCTFQKNNNFNGTIFLVASTTGMKSNKKEYKKDAFFVRELSEPSDNKWTKVQKSFTIPEAVSRLVVHIRGTFNGKVYLKDISLVRLQ